DLFPYVMARVWARETQQKKFLKNWIVKQKVTNHNPMGFTGLAMNMRRAPFDDRRVRLAMAHLMNREKINSGLLYNMYFLHKSYFESLYDAAHPCKNELVSFDKQKARGLLAEAGWKANPTTGILEKNGKPFAFKFLSSAATLNKYLVIYQQDLKDVGIEMTIDQKDWASWLKDMDEFHYDMTGSNWMSGSRDDPEGMWHSKEADRQASSNITGFKNARVDELIEKQKSIFDLQERNKIYREIDSLIFNEHPYVLLWNLDYQRLLYWNRFGTPPTVLSKFDREESAYKYWWASPDTREELRDAVRGNWALPHKELEIKFDEKFGK
ncbi:TPA: ABC transporter substrate-binding protein, partial [Candidatus Sumerlaeota bacterium]|nr:ABC transporter substrate-binding protein [Candidatus Sumerlaeota bacterium]